MIVSLHDRHRDDLREMIAAAPPGSNMILVVNEPHGTGKTRFRALRSGPATTFEIMGMLWAALRGYDDAANGS